MAEEKSSGCSPESCSSCAHAGSCSSAKKDLKAPANPYSQVKKVIGVVSGKGGVGKSMVTASLARMMVQQGYSVGILDADITGPSIPKAFGVTEKAYGTQMGILPCGYHRTIYPEDVWSAWKCSRKRGGNVPVRCKRRHKDHVGQSASGTRIRSCYLERTGDRRSSNPVLD